MAKGPTKKSELPEIFIEEYNEICGACGKTLGSHHAGTQPHPYNTCPATEAGMDWDDGPGTVFWGTGIYK